MKRSKILENVAEKKRRQGELKDLNIPKGQTIKISYDSADFKSHYHLFKPESVDEIKEIIGIPPGIILDDSKSKKEDSKKFFSRTFAPGSFKDKNVSNEQKIEIKQLTRMTTKKYIFGEIKELGYWKYIINEYLEDRVPLLFVAYFDDITIQDGGILDINAQTFTVYADKIKMYGSGKIRCDGSTTIDCISMEGNL